MTKRTDHNAIKVTRHYACRISNRLATSQLNIIFAQEQGMTAKLIGPNLKRNPCTGRRLLKNKSHRFSFERLIFFTIFLLVL
ncbi:hypothetical protein D3C81_2046290 [compost metagenome]